ncbi:uncharacterized protein K441DRAFT_218535 [Cenococcum geophilum 1.58]|uniref:uncharacterized protein n=1 Tax=Cenococcum geophilum 1.58 TaxID=794803 RepID=UPI00358FF151|nr:hypothetical protein K441DRAFT_218535 [Cenococcum geophilum 1.58]
MTGTLPPRPLALESSLGARFIALATTLGASPAAAHIWADTVIQRYKEPQRHYHTLEHIATMFRCLDACRAMLRDEAGVALAIFFHDMVYDPRRADNEHESVSVFEEFAASVGLAKGMTGKVVGFIERTVTHTLPGGEGEGDLELFLDFDLEVLARPNEEYEVYEEDEYRKGRVGVLGGFLERERLYLSEKFYVEKEEAARRNLRAEIERLEQLRSEKTNQTIGRMKQSAL